jgi:hypothetical protein
MCRAFRLQLPCVKGGDPAPDILPSDFLPKKKELPAEESLGPTYRQRTVESHGREAT